MTTRNTHLAKALASVASQVVKQWRRGDASELTNNQGYTPWLSTIRTRTGLRVLEEGGRAASHIDPSWQYTLPERYQA